MRRRAIWTRTLVSVTSHYICLRSRLFGVEKRDAIALFDVTEIVATENGDTLIRVEPKVYFVFFFGF